MQVLWWYQFLVFLRIQWRRYKSTLYWLLFCLAVGIVVGIITIFIADISVDDINYHLIDGNILNATSINTSMGKFIWQRVLSIIIPIIVSLVFACLSRFTAMSVFPLIFMHGYWLAIAVWWTFFYYSFTAIPLLIFYLLWLIIVTTVIIAGLLWALQCGENIRNQRHKNNSTKTNTAGLLLRGAAIFISIAVVLGFFEYLVFWTILGKIVYKPR